MTPLDPAPAAEPAEPKPAKDSRGRFIRGNSGGPGNPFGRRVAELRKEVLEAVADGEVKRLVRTILERAHAGDMAAARLIMQYALGKPAEAVDPDRVDVEEYRLARDSAVPEKDLIELWEQFPASHAMVLNEHVWPSATEKKLQPLLEKLDEDPRESRQAKKRRMRRLKRKQYREGGAPSPNGDDGGAPANGDAARSTRIFDPLGPNRAS